MEFESGEGQVQIQLVTRQPQYAVPETPYSIGANVGTDELNTLVNTILKENIDHNNVDFDFLVFGEYLRTRLGDHLKEKTISFEDVIQIEYVERYPAPEPKDCLLHDDWVSAVKTCENWILTGCYDNTLNIWTTKGNHVLTIPGHNSPIKAVAWISCDKTNATFVSCSQDQTAMLWEWNVEKNSVDCVYVCKGHERGVDSVDVSPDKSRFATGSWDTMLKIWSADINDKDDPCSKKARPESGKSRTPNLTLQGHRECISSVQWMDQATILTGSWDHTLKIWDLHLEGMKSEITGNKSFFDASYSKLNGLVITASADKNLRLYDPRSNRYHVPEVRLVKCEQPIKPGAKNYVILKFINHTMHDMSVTLIELPTKEEEALLMEELRRGFEKQTSITSTPTITSSISRQISLTEEPRFVDKKTTAALEYPATAFSLNHRDDSAEFDEDTQSNEEEPVLLFGANQTKHRFD